MTGNPSGQPAGKSWEAARARVVIEGIVQGVGFRAHTVRQAERRCLSGWVRNRDDGAVEAVFEGRREAVEDMIAWCRQGPPYARVDGVEVSWEQPAGEFRGFGVKY
ncbi:MAG: acylphosphatase [Planctomycetes bacterium]|nr:acylphosphatase [Planctomycetota bacterium]